MRQLVCNGGVCFIKTGIVQEVLNEQRPLSDAEAAAEHREGTRRTKQHMA